MKQSTKRFLSMIGGLVLIVAALMVYFQFIDPAYRESQKVKSQQLAHILLLRQEQAAIEKVRELISAYQAQGEVQQAVSLALPPKEDAAGAVAQLYGIAKNTGLELRSVSVSARGPQAASSGETPSGAAKFSLRKPLGTITIALQLSGSYEEFKEFLSLLENNLRIFDVQSIVIIPESGSAGKSGALYGFNLSVVTYYQSN